jgi:sugar phosphate isomerase/epimerase
MIAVSTSWNSYRCETGEKIVEEINSLGTEEIELSCYYSREKKVKELIDLVEKGYIRVNSVHNFCPIIEENYEGFMYYSLTSDSEEEREKAIKYTKITIDYATLLKASSVVIHAGEIPVENLQFQIYKLIKENGNNSKEHKILLGKALKEREEKKKIYWERALKGIEIISSYAEKKKIKIGVENRYFYFEIPNIEEIGELIEYFPDVVFYWHDVGHAQVMENIGLTEHFLFLKNYRKKMLGIHLHDIIGISDHRAPSFGEMNFEKIKENIETDVIKVMELNKMVNLEEAKKGLEYLKKIFGGGIKNG